MIDNTAFARQMSPESVGIPDDPPTVSRDIILSKVVQLVVNFTPTTIEVDLTPNSFAGALPGGPTFWSKIRIHKISCWGSSLGLTGTPSPGITLTIAGDNEWDQPSKTYIDEGIPGRSRPKVAGRAGLLQRSRWFGVADTTTLAKITGSASEQIIVHGSVEIIRQA